MKHEEQFIIVGVADAAETQFYHYVRWYNTIFKDRPVSPSLRHVDDIYVEDFDGLVECDEY